MHTPPSFAVNKSNAIQFCKTTLWRDEISTCSAFIASVVEFFICSNSAEIFTIAFSNSLTPKLGINHLMKLWYPVVFSTKGFCGIARVMRFHGDLKIPIGIAGPL